MLGAGQRTHTKSIEIVRGGGPRDLGNADVQGKLLRACSAFPIQSRLPNSQSLAQVVFEILCSKRIGVTSLTFQPICHFLVVVLWNQISISNGFRDIQRVM